MAFVNALLTHLKLLPNFHNENSTAFRLIFMAKIRQHFRLGALSSLSFCSENMARMMPHFYGENLAKFRVWCATAHWEGLILVYTTCVNMLGLRQAKAH